MVRSTAFKGCLSDATRMFVRDAMNLIDGVDLAPAATYPRALQQAVALLDHLLNTAGRDPRTVRLPAVRALMIAC